jgi:hypothetical protein
MPLKYLDDGNYQAGMIRDVPSWLLDKGQSYDALNMLFDTPGVARQRGGSTALSALGSVTGRGRVCGISNSQVAAPLETLYTLDHNQGINWWNLSTGAPTLLGNIFGGGALAAQQYGRPVRHFGWVVFPYVELGVGFGARKYVSLAGSTLVFSSGLSSVANASVSAGSPTITLTGADTTANVRAGQNVMYFGPVELYTGRVTAVVDATHFNVWPLPTITSAVITSTTTNTYNVNSDMGGACAASFQNRLLFGNCNEGFNSLAVSPPLSERRVYYSALPTETIPVGAQLYAGAHYIDTATWPLLNYFEIPGADPIVAIEPIDDNRLLILTSQDVVIFEGNLITQLATTSPSITFSVYSLGTTSGCLSDLSVCKTPGGVVWAGAEGIFAYAPPSNRARAGVHDLTDGKINTYWRQLVRGSSFSVHGSYYVRGHYFISGESGGSTWALCVNLATGAWSRLSGAGTDIHNGVHRPTDPSQVFALRYWSGAGSFTNGQVVRVESILDQYTAGSTKTDADGAAVPFSITTRVLAADTETQKIMQRGTVRYQASETTAGVALTARSGIDAADAGVAAVALGSLSNTNTLTITAATAATPIVCTTATHGLQTDDYVDVVGGAGMPAINGRYRITVLSTTTFSLNGTIGTGVYTASSATAKKLTESDFQMTDLVRTQGVALTISGSPNNFALHGMRIAYLDGAPVMSA